MQKYIIVVAIAALVLSSCEGREIMRCDFSAAEKELIPYKKGQVYSFIDGAGKTIDVTVISAETRWPESRDETERDYYTFRSDVVELNSEQDNLRIWFRFDANDCFLGRGYNRIVFSVVLRDNTCVFELRSNAEGIIDDTYISFHESVEINGKVYYDVVKQTRKYDIENGLVLQLFYNTTYGILQINENGKNFLTIKPAEEVKKSSSPNVQRDTAENKGYLLQLPSNASVKVAVRKKESEATTQKELPEKEFDFDISPNPNDGNFIITVEAKEVQPFVVEIFNSAGTLVSKKEYGGMHQASVSQSGLPLGVYFVKVTMGKKVLTKKIVVS